MALMSRRSRMVSIRLSDEEFKQLLEACHAHGARSISDLAREAMHRMVLNGKANGPELGEKVRELDARLAVLQDEVARLRDRA